MQVEDLKVLASIPIIYGKFQEKIEYVTRILRDFKDQIE